MESIQTPSGFYLAGSTAKFIIWNGLESSWNPVGIQLDPWNVWIPTGIF
jgi:hypothetical protein